MKDRSEIDISINEDSGIPLWLQLRNRLIYLISRGYYREGDQLPTVRELAVELGINYNTVSKVYQDIERDGYILSKRGKGTFVAKKEHANHDNPNQDSEVLFKDFIRQCEELGIPQKDIPDLVREHLSI